MGGREVFMQFWVDYLSPLSLSTRTDFAPCESGEDAVEGTHESLIRFFDHTFFHIGFFAKSARASAGKFLKKVTYLQ